MVTTAAAAPNSRLDLHSIFFPGLADDILDVAVICLSLMGRNWTDYIIEAKRCLATPQ